MQGKGKVRQSKARPGKGQSKVKERSRKGQSKVKVTSRQCEIKIKVRSKQGQDNIKRRSRQGQGNAKARSMRVQGKVKVRSKQRKHNLNSNNNLMGFDTIEINLVFHFLSCSQFLFLFGYKCRGEYLTRNWIFFPWKLIFHTSNPAHRIPHLLNTLKNR